MRVSPLALSIGVLAALSGWVARGIQFVDDGVVIAAVPPPVIAAVTPAAEPPLAVQVPHALPHESYGSRNLFAYVEPPPPLLPRVVVVEEPAPLIVPPPAVAPPAETSRPRLKFAYRYIGNFGTHDRPIAAFERDGEIVTVRIGDRIDTHFVLRRLGIESAEVEADGQVERVKMTAR